jgi:hypothetical protein
VEATTAARLVDPYAQGSLGPVGAFVDGTLTLFHGGRFHFGPSLGLQLGFDASVSQLAIQPGFGVFARLSPRVAVHGRIGVPLLVTRGLCPDEAPLEIPVGMGQLRGGGIAPNQGVVRVPGAGYCPTLAVGVELGAGAAFYLTSGLALTGEVTFDFYRGDTVGFPLVGGGLGILMDLEVLP